MARPFPGTTAVTEDELLAIAYAVDLLPQPVVDVTNLLPTPDERVWFDPTIPGLVRIPAGARLITDPQPDVVPDPDGFDPLNPDKES